MRITMRAVSPSSCERARAVSERVSLVDIADFLARVDRGMTADPCIAHDDAVCRRPVSVMLDVPLMIRVYQPDRGSPRKRFNAGCQQASQRSEREILSAAV
jgi:hypothetical protein